MPALTMPSSPAFKSSRFGLEFNSDTFRNQLTNQMQVVERAGARWRAQYTLPAMSRAQMAQWQAFLAALRGQAGTFMGYDPEGLTPRGANTQVASSTNQIPYSTNYAHSSWNGYWQKPTFTTGQLAPDGTLTASSWTDTSTTGNGGTVGGLFRVDGTAVVGETWTSSAWLRASSALNVQFGLADGRVGNITLGTSWQRYTYTGTATSSQRVWQLIENTQSGTDVFIWGAMTERGAVATPYIPTAGAAATRPAGVTVYGAGQSGSTLRVRGFASLLINALMAGDYIGVGGRMYMLTANASTDLEGAATLSITPALASSPADGAAVTTSGATCEMRLLDEGQASWSTNAMGVCSGLTFSAIEAL